MYGGNSTRPVVAPAAGDIVVIGAEASVQFEGGRRLLFRVTSVDQKMTHRGSVWMTGYMLNRVGLALDQREIFCAAD